MSDYVSAKAARRAEEEKALRERRKYNITAACIAGAVVILVIFVALFGSNLFYSGTTALQIGDMKFSVVDFNYNYFTSYNSYYNNISSYGITDSSFISSMLPSTDSSFRDQAYPGNEDQTWADFLEETAIERMKSVAMLVSAANAEGFTLSEEDTASVEEVIDGLRTSAVSYGYKDLNAYLVINYGKGMNEKQFRQCLLRDALASAYSTHKSESFTYTADEISAYYAEHADDNDYFKYRYYSFSGAAVTDDEDTEEDETLSAEDAAAKAKTDADAFLAAVTDEQSYLDYAASLNSESESYDADASTLRTLQGSSISGTVKEWLTDPSRKAGDVAALKSPDDSEVTYYYVVYFLDRDNNQYNAFSGYYGMVSGTPSAEEDAEVTDEATREYRESLAKEVLDTYNSGSEKSLDAFTAVLNNSSDTVTDSGSITTSGIYDVPEALVEWFSDPARVEGDTEVLYDEDYGALVVYFSQVDGVYADLMAEAQMRNEDYTAWEEAQSANYETVTRHWQMGLSKKITALGG